MTTFWNLLITFFICLFIQSAHAQDYSYVPNFGINGISHIDYNQINENAYCGARDNNGNYYIGGSSIVGPQQSFSICKVMHDGQPDPAFGVNGHSILNIPGYNLGFVLALAIQSDGKIVFAGQLFTASSQYDAIVGRINPNGQLDLTFNTTGYRIYNQNNSHDAFVTAEIQPDGKIVAAGYATIGSSMRAVTCRFNADGSFDNTFATAGKLLLSFYSDVKKVKVLPAGEIVIGGMRGNASNTRMYMAKFSPAGVLDTGFGASGYLEPATPTAYVSNSVTDFDVRANGDFVAVGYGNPGVDGVTYVLHIYSNGTLDYTYAPDGYLTLEHPSKGVVGSRMFLRDDASVLICGYLLDQEQDRFAHFCEVSSTQVMNTAIGINGYVLYSSAPIGLEFEDYSYIYEENDGVVCSGYTPNAPNSDSLLPCVQYMILKMNNCIPTSAVLTETACGSYILNGQAYTSSGTYTQTLTKPSGCDSTITLHLTVNHVDTSVVIGNMSISSAIDNAVYQWIDCNTNLPVENATQQLFETTTNGTYAVIVTANGCTDTSICVTLPFVLGTQEMASLEVSLYPNPVDGQLTISLAGVEAGFGLRLYSVNGQLVDVRGDLTSAVEMLDVSGLAKGIYYLDILLKSGFILREKVMKE